MLLSLSACGPALKSDYQRPTLSIPNQWRASEHPSASGASYLSHGGQWWEHFQDPGLSRAINALLESNNDLALADIALQQARLTAGLRNSHLTPDFNASLGARNSKNISTSGPSSESYSSGLNASYELDLWGRLARSRDQAEWLAKASEQDSQAMALTLIGRLAQLYWQLGSLNQQIVNGQQSLNIAEHSQRLVTSRFNAGEVSRLDVVQAEQTILNRRVTLRDLEQQREEARNAMALLFNGPPSQRQAEPLKLNINQSVAVVEHLPLEIIARRPDLQAAELNLRAALAGSDVARLDFYPRLTLDASLGAGAAAFQQWFSNPVRTLGSTLSLPFIEWNKVQLTVEQSKLEVQRAAIQFRSKAYSALSDVDNAMSQRMTYQQQKQSQRLDWQLSQQRLQLAQSQYRAGAVSYQTWLDAQDALLNSENTRVQTQYHYLYATMKLWLALGGG
jgi:NodT family efflux transporter outer membrane factor (OMF) lipoprotein